MIPENGNFRRKCEVLDISNGENDEVLHDLSRGHRRKILTKFLSQEAARARIGEALIVNHQNGVNELRCGVSSRWGPIHCHG